MIPLLWGQWQAHSPSVGTAESQMPSRLSWGIGRAATLLKTLLQYFWQVFRGIARCRLPRFQGQPQHLKYQNRIKKMHSLGSLYTYTCRFNSLCPALCNVSNVLLCNARNLALVDSSFFKETLLALIVYYGLKLTQPSSRLKYKTE